MQFKLYIFGFLVSTISIHSVWKNYIFRPTLFVSCDFLLTIEILAVILSLRLLDFHLEGDQMMERKQIFIFFF